MRRIVDQDGAPVDSLKLTRNLPTANSTFTAGRYHAAFATPPSDAPHTAPLHIVVVRRRGILRLQSRHCLRRSFSRERGGLCGGRAASAGGYLGDDYRLP